MAHLWGKCEYSCYNPTIPIPSRNAVLIYIDIYVCILYTSSGYTTYVYIHTQGMSSRSVLVKMHPITVYRTAFLGVRGSCVECHLLFSLVSPNVSCSVINRLKLGCLFCILQSLTPREFLPLDLLLEYRSYWTYGAIGHLDVTSSYSTRIVYRGVSGFATDCPCGVWCRGLTTCLLYVCPLFVNRLLNNSWAVGLT